MEQTNRLVVGEEGEDEIVEVGEVARDSGSVNTLVHQSEDVSRAEGVEVEDEGCCGAAAVGPSAVGTAYKTRLDGVVVEGDANRMYSVVQSTEEPAVVRKVGHILRRADTGCRQVVEGAGEAGEIER